MSGLRTRMQDCDDDLVVMRELGVVHEFDSHGNREVLAVAYNITHDNLELVALSRGPGCGDDRVVCDDEPHLSVEELAMAAHELDQLALAAEVHEEAYRELRDYVQDIVGRREDEEDLD
jgi:hypothetical protein